MRDEREGGGFGGEDQRRGAGRRRQAFGEGVLDEAQGSPTALHAEFERIECLGGHLELGGAIVE